MTPKGESVLRGHLNERGGSVPFLFKTQLGLSTLHRVDYETPPPRQGLWVSFSPSPQSLAQGQAPTHHPQPEEAGGLSEVCRAGKRNFAGTGQLRGVGHRVSGL